MRKDGVSNRLPGPGVAAAMAVLLVVAGCERKQETQGETTQPATAPDTWTQAKAPPSPERQQVAQEPASSPEPTTTPAATPAVSVSPTTAAAAAVTTGTASVVPSTATVQAVTPVPAASRFRGSMQAIEDDLEKLTTGQTRSADAVRAAIPRLRASVAALRSWQGPDAAKLAPRLTQMEEVITQIEQNADNAALVETNLKRLAELQRLVDKD